MNRPPRIWSIGASDSSAGAGLQADLNMAHAHRIDAGQLTVAVTAQSSLGVKALHCLPADFCEQQWQALLDDGLPDVIRIGWLPPEQQLIQWLLAKLADFSGWVVWDPVLSATQGGLPQQNDAAALWQPLLPLVDVITPNYSEACRLAGLATDCATDEVIAALRQRGAQHILLTGTRRFADASGTWQEDEFYPALAEEGSTLSDELPGPSLLSAFRLRHAFIRRDVHGTGCHLAAQLACSLAQQYTLYDSVVRAVASARQAIRLASVRASGYDNAWAADLADSQAEDWPQVLAFKQPQMAAFQGCERALGLYALTDNLSHLKALLKAGVDTLQWRVKVPQADYEQNTAEAIALCREAQVPLYINDDWPLAIRLNAYGVHLGQEDLGCADLQALAAAGLRLGVSTHSDWEIARARALQPSYIAFGPVFIPLSKKLRYQPLGIDQVALWSSRFSEYTLTCIGGMTEHNIACLNRTAMPSAALVTALADGPDLEARVLTLRKLMPRLEKQRPGPILENS